MSTRMHATFPALALACALGAAPPAIAQAAMQDMPTMDPASPEQHPRDQHAAHPQPDQQESAAHGLRAPVSAANAPQDAQPGHAMDMASIRGGDAPPDARGPDYSDGHGYGSMAGMGMHDDPWLGMLLLDRLEYVHPRDGGDATAIDGEAWFGRNFNKLWLKFEGEHTDGRWHDLRTEALWSHAVAPFWDTQLGVRHDSGAGPGRTWAAFGIEGTAPYWFETEATLYVGQGGRTAARVALEYEARFTQRLILQPSVEANLYGRNDPRRGIGSGLSDIEAGLRLRYEIRREFAPYVGVAWQQRFGRSRGYARALGEPGEDLQFVAGFRIWF
ncbi:MAG TPA: copper resistance protein B [Rhodanobacteraceae bacterium]|nr:copper resistance protein B [Rhodanobacteraceae bacterium]